MYSRGRRLLLMAVILVCAGGASYLLWPVIVHKAAQAIMAAQSVSLADAPPDFTLPDARGNRIQLSAFRGKVVLLNFWATWCGPCKAEIPWFVDFQKNYQNRGFSVLGVSLDEEGWKVVNPYVAAQKINYPIVLGTEEVNQKYGGIEAIPTSLLIGREGKIAYLHAGLISRDEYRKEILQLLERAPSQSETRLRPVTPFAAFLQFQTAFKRSR